MSESDLLEAIAELCHDLGLLWHHCKAAYRCTGKPGIPDLIIAGVAGTMFIELKGEDGYTSAEQDLWIWTLSRTCEVHVWRPRDWDSGKIKNTLKMISAELPPARPA